MPTLIWLPDMCEDAANFESFFNDPTNKCKKVRNIWLLNYRNQGNSDHHDSYSMDEMSNDIIRFMDDNQITMATIGGHGFGAKVATATATSNLERFTGVMALDGGPIDHTHHEAYKELKGYVSNDLIYRLLSWRRKTSLSSETLRMYIR